MFDDGDVGEIFIKMSKEGSTVSGLMDTIATLTSVALQYGVPLDALVKKFRYAAFEPAGWTGNPEVHHATSIVDYIFRWLELKFPKSENAIAVVDAIPVVRVNLATNGKASTSTGQICPDCGHVTQRTGSCFACPTCGWTGGCG
jgi:ribonucleoside-diphosphate reductase alpha chain